MKGGRIPLLDKDEMRDKETAYHEEHINTSDAQRLEKTSCCVHMVLTALEKEIEDEFDQGEKRPGVRALSMTDR